MASHPVVGVYHCMARARLAQEALIVEGMPEDRIAISMDFNENAAAEASGSSQASPPDDPAARGWSGSRPGRGHEAPSRPAESARSGGCVVRAEARDAAEAGLVREVMAALHPIDVKVPGP